MVKIFSDYILSLNHENLGGGTGGGGGGGGGKKPKWNSKSNLSTILGCQFYSGPDRHLPPPLLATVYN